MHGDAVHRRAPGQGRNDGEDQPVDEPDAAEAGSESNGLGWGLGLGLAVTAGAGGVYAMTWRRRR